MVAFKYAPRRRPYESPHVTGDRWRRIADQIERVDPSRSLGHRVCAVAADVLAADNASLALVVNHATSWIEGSSDCAVVLDEQQFSLGDGPTFMAIDSLAPVMAIDMTSPEALRRWPAFAPVAIRHDAIAVFSFPLRVGEARLGVMSAYRSQPGELTAVEYADGLVVASLATMALLQEQAGASPGDLAVAFSPGVIHQSQVQLAAGMVSEQLDVSIIEALVRLRAYAYAHEQSVNSAAQSVISRELAFQKEEMQ